ncbi:rod shape-determining protein MreC [Clostridium sp. SY8519]|uniref:rod shape-determining protein MreC n=1 Tax=Clostridium sp. (strain SY8519) TaxID=1042156 RepID=UPI0002E2EBB3|nr:rod shape-determining protein MreC [Clostridium sp. SY8519]
MKRQQRKKRKSPAPRYVLVIMVILCIVLISIGKTASASKSGAGASIAGYAVVPMQKGINKVGTVFHGVSTFFTSKQKLEKENTSLKQQIDELQLQVDASEITKHELEQYQDMYKTDKTYDKYEKVAADIIDKNSGNWFSTFLINRGRDSGIRAGMNVIAGGGLAGIVTDVGKDYAKVRSIIDDSSNVSAMDSATSDLCIVNGSLKSMNQKQQIEFSDMRNSKKLKAAKGDKLVTSAVSSRYLKGIPIGYITSLETDSGDLTKSGTVVPIVDFDHLEHVFVILTTKNYDNAND